MKQCLVQDNDAHWYCIPVDLTDSFYTFMVRLGTDDLESVETLALFENVFGKMRLEHHLSCYSFENWERL